MAATITALLAVLVVRAPRAAVVAVIIYLTQLSLIRRLLISGAPWTSHDPLLLVGPIIVGLLCVQTFVLERRPLFADRMINSALLLLVLSVAEVANPSGGGLSVGLGGLLFFATPLLWFVLGRELGNRQTVMTLMYVVLAIAVLEAAYGTIQAQIGFPAWDRGWLSVVGTGLLSVGGGSSQALRPVGSLSSPSEYMAVLAIGMACTVGLSRRSPVLLLMIPVLLGALFLGSGRTQFALSIFALCVMASLALLRGRASWLALGGSAAALLGVVVLAGPLLTRVASTSSNALIAHQATGLSDPFSSSGSTLSTHTSAFLAGIEAGITHPLGEGTGISTIAADNLSAAQESGTGTGTGRVLVNYDGAEESIRGTDVDVSNVFLSFGIGGGLIYLALLAMLTRRLLLAYQRGHDPLVLAVIGIFVVCGLEWLTGGRYSTAAVSWFLFGWAARPPTPSVQGVKPVEPKQKKRWE